MTLAKMNAVAQTMTTQNLNQGHPSSNEKGVLKLFMEAGEKSVTLALQNSTVSGLQRQGLLIQGNAGNVMQFPFMLQPCVWHHLKANPELLEGAADVNVSPWP